MVTSDGINSLLAFIEAAALRLPSYEEDIFRAQWPMLARALLDEAVESGGLWSQFDEDDLPISRPTDWVQFPIPHSLRNAYQVHPGGLTTVCLADLPETDPAQMTTVYRLISRPGLLLYVGIAKDVVKRLGEHRKDKDWWHKVARIEIHTYPTRADARTAELQMIIDEQPRYNKSVDV